MFKFPSVFPLNNGLLMPTKGLGTAGAKNFPDIILRGLELGYRAIDTAKLYQTEEAIGKALTQAFALKLVKREEVFLTSKIFNDSERDPELEVRDSLAKLGVEYLDLLLIHWPNGRVVEDKDGKVTVKQRPLHVLWGRLEGLVKKGLVKSLGLSNFNTQFILDLLSYCEIKPVVNQIEVQPYNTQQNLVEFCQRFGIQVTAYSQFCNGAWKKDSQEDIYGNVIRIFDDPKLQSIAKKYGRSVANVILNWLLWRGINIIPKTDNLKQLEENFRCDEFVMEDEDYKEISRLNRNYRAIDAMNKNNYSCGLPVFE